MAPTLSISPATYKKGDPLVLTITDTPRPSTPAEHDLIDVTNPATGQVGHTAIDFAAVPGQPFQIVDSSGRPWTLMDDDFTTAHYKGTA
jgi:hypothetical protein